MRSPARLLALLVLALSASAWAGEKLLQNDLFDGTGPVFAPISFPDYAGAGVLLDVAPADLPAQLIAVDVLCAPTAGSGGDPAAYLIDVWSVGTDGGVAPPATNSGDLYSSGVQLTSSTTQLNRFTFPQPIVLTGKQVFVAVREQLSSALDGTTIAMDTGPVLGGHEWYFNGAGGWVALTGSGTSAPGNVDRNWILRGVLSVPDVAPTVVSITPDAGTNAQDVAVVVAGDHFTASSRVFLGTTELTVTSRVPPQSLFATVPAGLAGGTYDVIVENPGPPTLRGTLSAGYTVLDVVDAGQADAGAPDAGSGSDDGGTGADAGVPGALRLDSVNPAEVYAQDSSSLTAVGAGFDPAVQLLVGGRALPVTRGSAAVLTASVAPDALPVGTWDVTAINPDGTRATLAQALTVRAGVSVPAGCGCGAGTGLAPLAALALLGLLARRRRPTRA